MNLGIRKGRIMANSHGYQRHTGSKKSMLMVVADAIAKYAADDAAARTLVCGTALQQRLRYKTKKSAITADSELLGDTGRRVDGEQFRIPTTGYGSWARRGLTKCGNTPWRVRVTNALAFKEKRSAD